MANPQPLVSILMPAFNAVGSIQRALSSLVAQTFGDWEAVFVDDGSTDGTWQSALGVADDRVRRFRLETNVGRGAARQLALSHSAGFFVCMLDGDDWYYPWKLERQLEELEKCPEAALVSSAMASVDQSGDLRGIWRGSQQPHSSALAPPLKSLFELSFPHAPCMIRASAARTCQYCGGLRRAEDYHYLARMLRGRPFLVSDKVLYSYADEVSFSREGPVPRYLWSAWASLRLLRDYPTGAAMLTVRKTLQGVLAFLSGGRRIGSRARPWSPTPEEADEFATARCQVDEVMAGLGISPGYGTE